MSLDKIVDHLPFMDGSGRRRFVAGGIVFMGIALLDSSLFTKFPLIADVGFGAVLKNPVLAAGAVLLVYAIGSLAEMLGELSLVRAASGIFLALQYPGKTVTWDAVPTRNWFYGILIFIMRLLLFITFVPFRVLYFALAGFAGFTRFSIDVHQHTSKEASKVFQDLPNAVKSGLRVPVGNNADFAQKYIVSLMSGEQDRKWARRLLIRAKDVAATITAIQFVVLFALLSYGAKSANPELIEGQENQQTQAQLNVIEATSQAASIRVNSLSSGALNLFDRALSTESIRDKIQNRSVVSKGDIPGNRFINLQISIKNSVIADNNQARKRIDELDEEWRRLQSRPKNEPQNSKIISEQKMPAVSSVSLMMDIDGKKEKLDRDIKRMDEVLLHITELKDFMGSLENQKVIKKLDNTIEAYNNEVIRDREQQVLINLLLTGIWLLFLPLYFGYFTTLRNAIVTILEAAASPIAARVAEND